MDSQCKKFVSTCIACQSNTPQTHREPLKMTDLPEGPWDKVSVDFCGPMASGDLALVFYCQYARYPVVEFVGPTSEKATIPIVRRVFDTGTGVGLVGAIAYHGKLDAPAQQSPWQQLWQVLTNPQPPLLGLQQRLNTAL